MFLEENQVTYKSMRLRIAPDFSAKLPEGSGGFQNSEGKAFQNKNSLPRQTMSWVWGQTEDHSRYKNFWNLPPEHRKNVLKHFFENVFSIKLEKKWVALRWEGKEIPV